MVNAHIYVFLSRPKSFISLLKQIPNHVVRGKSIIPLFQEKSIIPLFLEKNPRPFHYSTAKISLFLVRYSSLAPESHLTIVQDDAKFRMYIAVKELDHVIFGDNCLPFLITSNL